MAIKLVEYQCQAKEPSGSVLQLELEVGDAEEALKFLGSLNSLIYLMRERGVVEIQFEGSGGKAASVVEAASGAVAVAAINSAVALDAAPAVEPVRQAKRSKSQPALAAVPAAEVAAKPIEEKVTPPLAAVPAPTAAPAPAAAPAPKAALQRAPEPAAAPVAAPAAVAARSAIEPLPFEALAPYKIVAAPPPEVAGAKSFREVIVYLLGAGVATAELVYTACVLWRPAVPIIDRMMQPQADPEAEILPRIVRALEVIQKKKA